MQWPPCCAHRAAHLPHHPTQHASKQTAMAAPAQSHESLGPKTLQLSDCMHASTNSEFAKPSYKRIRQSRPKPPSPKPPPHSETAESPLGYPCARHAATDTRRGSRASAALSAWRRLIAGHPGPEPHRVSRPWRPAVGLRPRLIPGVTSVTRDLLSRVRYIKPPGQPPAVGRYEGHIR